MADSSKVQLSKGKRKSKQEKLNKKTKGNLKKSNSKNQSWSQVLNDNDGRKDKSPSSHDEPPHLDMLFSDFLESRSTRSNEALQGNFDELKSQISDRVINDIRELQQKVKDRKEWAQRVVIEAATRVSKDHMELITLRMEKAKNEKIENKKNAYHVETSNGEAEKMQHEEVKADTEAYKLCKSDSDRNIEEMTKRCQKGIEKLVNAERKANVMRSQHENEVSRKLQLEQELSQAEKEVEEAEVAWRHEINKKEHINALVDEETKTLKAQKAKSRAYLLNLESRVEADCQLLEDECYRLTNELSSLYLNNLDNDSLLDDINFPFNSCKATSSRSNSLSRPIGKALSRWVCMICMQNEVSVVFLPCKHQVLCFPCFGRICNGIGSRCPSCGVKIEEGIKVYGRSA